jgi:ferritin-like metal-binding protein YciE
MAQDSPNDVIKAYLQDAIAAERNFETQLRQFAREGENELVQRMFLQHADETRLQHERLSARLKAIGGSPSTMKSILAHLLGAAPKAGQLFHDESERTVQNLIIAYTVENSEVAMYEALAIVAAAAGDSETEELARSIQLQERQTADKVWSQIANAARTSFIKLERREAAGEEARRAG